MENKRWIEEKPLGKDNGYKRIEVEQVSNGYIKTVTICDDSKGDYSTVRSIHEDNPLEEVSLAEKLKRVIEGKD